MAEFIGSEAEPGSEIEPGLETERKPDNQLLFKDSRFGSQIEKAIGQTEETGNECCFLAAINLEANDIVVNDLFMGKTHGIDLHYPASGKQFTHPENKGFYLMQDLHPYFEFHTHPSSGSRPSPKDIANLFDVAKQNFNLTSDEADWWINPVSVISGQNGEISAYQIEPEKVENLDSNEDLIFQLGKACLEQVEKMEKQNRKGLKKEQLELFRSNPTLLFWNDDPNIRPIGHLAIFPTRLTPHLDQIYPKVGIRKIKFKWRGQEDMTEKLRSFQIATEL